jgi:hypothetical protein
MAKAVLVVVEVSSDREGHVCLRGLSTRRCHWLGFGAIGLVDYRGTSLIRNSPPHSDPQRTLGIGLR